MTQRLLYDATINLACEICGIEKYINICQKIYEKYHTNALILWSIQVSSLEEKN